MPHINPNFDEAVGELPVGSYHARITGSELKTAKSSGATYVRWELTVFGASEDAWNGRKTWTNTMTSGRGAGMLAQFVKAATGEEAPASFDTEDLHGREVNITVVAGTDRAGNPSGFSEVKRVSRYSAD